MAKAIHLFSAYDSNHNLNAQLPAHFTWLYCGADTTQFFYLQKLLGADHPLASQPEEFAAFVIKLRDEFVAEMELVNDAFGDSIDYWVDDLYSKNPHAENIFFSYCLLRFIEDVVNRKQSGDLVLFFENPSLVRIVHARLAHNEDWAVTISTRWERIAKVTSNPVISYLKYLLSSVLMHLHARYRHPLADEDRLRRKMDILIETYSKPDDFSGKGEFRDRYFPGLFSFLQEKGLRVGVAPVLSGTGLREFVGVLSHARGDLRKTVLFKEDYLRIWDYLWAAMHPFRRVSHAELHSRLKDGLLRDILLAAHEKSRFSPMAYESLLRYRFAARLREAGCEVGRVVMWYENQQLHKAFCVGMRLHYPSSAIVGAQMFVPPINQMNLYSTASEGRAGILPNRFLVPGPAFLSLFSHYNRSADYAVAASMRYGYIVDAEVAALPMSAIPRIAVLLPQSLNISLNVLSVLFKALGEDTDKVVIAIRLHPTVVAEHCRRYMKEMGIDIPPAFFVEEPLRQLVMKSDVVVSAASGSVLESICMGRPVIEIGPSVGLDLAPYMVPEASMLYRKVYESAIARDVLFNWALGSVREFPAAVIMEGARKVMQRCFVPSGEETMTPFIGSK